MYILDHKVGRFCFDGSGRRVEGSAGKGLDQAPLHVQRAAMQQIRAEVDIAVLRERQLQSVWAQIEASVEVDTLIIQAMKALREEREVMNRLAVRLREWFEWYDPVASRAMSDHFSFVRFVSQRRWKQSSKTLSKRWSKRDVDAVVAFARSIEALAQASSARERYIEALLREYAPNMLALTSPQLAASLMELGGGLRRLALMPSSAIQLLGAEKALFRHLKTGARSPKHGIIVQHPLLASAPAKEHGKIARALADRLSMAARLDFFKGEFKGDVYRRELEEEFGR